MPLRSLLLVACAALTLTACKRGDAPAGGEAGAAGEPLVIYSGRSEALVEPLLDEFREATGLDVQARYGTDAELMAALREEGDRSPADLYWANTTGALVEADGANLFGELPDSIKSRPAVFVPADGHWVPVTTRFRVLAYNPTRVDSASLPTSVMALPQMGTLRSRIGWTPTYSSFQDFITGMRVLQGEDATRAWLDGMKALEPQAYPSNTPMIEALAAGEIDVALTNHYYILRAQYGGGEGEYEGAEEEEEEHGEHGEEHEEEEESAPAAVSRGLPVATFHFAPGDVGNLALVTGAGVLRTSTNQATAMRFLSFLLSAGAQRHAAHSVFEYPVVGGSELPPYMLSFDRARALSPPLDFARLTDLDGTLRLLRETELL